MRLCEVDGCTRKHKGHGLCNSHYARWKKTGTVDVSPIRPYAAGSGCWIDKRGYRILWRDSECIPEHRYVMQSILGRRLEQWENVHHKNGVRTDNDPSNLELWVVAQPQGQRVVDLVRWVVENYPDEVREAMS